MSLKFNSWKIVYIIITPIFLIGLFIFTTLLCFYIKYTLFAIISILFFLVLIWHYRHHYSALLGYIKEDKGKIITVDSFNLTISKVGEIFTLPTSKISNIKIITTYLLVQGGNSSFYYIILGGEGKTYLATSLMFSYYDQVDNFITYFHQANIEKEYVLLPSLSTIKI